MEPWGRVAVSTRIMKCGAKCFSHMNMTVLSWTTKFCHGTSHVHLARKSGSFGNVKTEDTDFLTNIEPPALRRRAATDKLITQADLTEELKDSVVTLLDLMRLDQQQRRVLQPPAEALELVEATLNTAAVGQHPRTDRSAAIRLTSKSCTVMATSL